jgi:protein ImuB
MFAVIRLPDFRLQAALRWHDAPPAAALIDGAETRAVILEVSEGAQAAGVRPGQTAAQGLARCPTLRLLPRSPAQEEACAALLVETALGFSPFVEATAPGAVTLDLTTTPRHVCWLQLGGEMRQRLGAEGVRAVVGFAPNPDHAWLAARGAATVDVVYDGATFCRSLPVTALEPDASIQETLHDWGIRTIGDLLRLPCAETISRLGGSAQALWERATGRRKRALRLEHPPEVFLEAVDWDHPVETTAPLLFLLRRFLEALCTRVRDQHRVVHRLRLTLPLDNGTRHEREFSVLAPTCGVESLYHLLDTHLETLRLDQQPTGVRLELFASAPLGRQLDIFARGLRDPNGFGTTLARLKAVVGEHGVGRPKKSDTHRPDAAEVGEFEEHPAAEAAALDFGLPLRRLRPPVPVNVRLRDFQPAWIDAVGWTGPVLRAGGPYRFSGAWWTGTPWGVEEWDVQVDGRGLLRIARRANSWTVEGIYNLTDALR